MDSNIKIGDFFSLLNSAEGVSEADYAKTELILAVVRAFERCTYQCGFIIDHFKKGFLYVSKNIDRLCGCEAEIVKDLGFRFYAEYVPKEDIKMLEEINIAGFEFFGGLPVGERKNYAISCNFHVKRDNGRRLVNHKLIPLILSEDGRIWLSLCSISLAAGNELGNAIVKKCGDDIFYKYSLKNHEWVRRKEIVLTDREREILTLSTQGYTMTDIADYICKSVDTIKAEKRRIFQKMNVKNIAEALTYAQNHRLI